MDKPEKRELKMANDDIHKWADEAVRDVITRCIRSLIANLEREARNLKRRLKLPRLMAAPPSGLTMVFSHKPSPKDGTMEKELCQLIDLKAEAGQMNTAEGGIIPSLLLTLTVDRQQKDGSRTVQNLPTIWLEARTALTLSEAIRSAMVKLLPEETVRSALEEISTTRPAQLS